MEEIAHLSTVLDTRILPKHAIVYGQRIPSATEKVAKVPGYDPKYLKFLTEKKLDIALPVQSYLWPCLFRGRSAVCISSPKSGKTLSYLIPTMSGSHFCGEDDIYGDEGPRVIVVCSSRDRSVQVRELAYQLKQDASEERVVYVDQDEEKSCHARILQGCTILITTPGPLLRLHDSTSVSFDYCKLLVFDDADRSFILHKASIQSIVATYCRAFRKTLPVDDPTKNALRAPMLLLGETWTDEIKKFAEHLMEDPLLIYGDFFEAALASKVDLQVYVDTDRNSRLAELVYGLISKNRGVLERTAIACANDTEALQVERLMKDLEVEPIRIDTTLVGLNIQTAILDCQNHPRAIAIVTDEVLKQMANLDFISRLIHYTVPDMNSERFKARFMLMSREIKQHSNMMSTYFILTSSNISEAHQLSNALKKLATEPSKELEELKKLHNRPLCKNYLAFAHCPYENSFCPERHYFEDESDAPKEELPQDGQLKFEISHVVSANEFYMRILQYRDSKSSDGSWFKFPYHLKDIDAELQSFRESRPPLKEKPNVGKIYGVFIRDKVKRVRVSSVEVENLFHLVSVNCIDTGERLRGPITELFELPDHLRNYPRLAFQAYLPGIKPVDNEIVWTTSATLSLKDLISQKKYLTSLAWIRFQRKGIFWLADLKIMERMVHLKRTLNVWNPKLGLIDLGLANFNEHTFPYAHKDYDIYLYRWTVLNQAKKSQYASVDKDRPEYCYLVNFISTSEFYLQKKKNVKLIKDLEKDISNSIKRKVLSKVAHPIPGLLCAAYHDYYESFNRAKIVSTEPDDTHALVFYLDWGESKLVETSGLYNLNNNFISKLPFQAIKCGFADYNGLALPDQVYEITSYKTENGCTLNHELLVNYIDTKEDTFLVQVFTRADDKKHWINLGDKLIEKGVLMEIVNIEGGLEIAMFTEEEEDVQEFDTDEEDFDEEWERKEARARKNFAEMLFERIRDGLMNMPQDEDHQYNPANRRRRTGRTARLLEAARNLPVYSRGIDSDVEDDDDNLESAWAELLDGATDEPKIDSSKILPYDPRDDYEDSDEDEAESDLEEFDDCCT